MPAGRPPGPPGISKLRRGLELDPGFGAEGPLTERLRTTYAEVVRGNRPAPGPWLTPV